MFQPSSTKRLLFFLLSDAVFSAFTLYGAYLLRFNFSIPQEFLTHFDHVAMVIVGLKLSLIMMLGGYSFIWRFFSLKDLQKLFYAHLLTYIFFVITFVLFPYVFSPFPRSVVIIDAFCSFTVLGGVRFAKQLFIQSLGDLHTLKPTLIIGISTHTDLLINGLIKTGYYPLALIAIREENHSMIGSTICNIKIYDPKQLQTLIQTHHLTTAIIDGSLPQSTIQSLYTQLQETPIGDIQRASILNDTLSSVEPLRIEDLLARHPQDLDRTTIERFIRGKVVAITGAGGSIGSEIALQCHQFGAKHLILIDHSEYNLYQIGEKLPHATLHLGSILHSQMLDTLWKKNRPDVLIHAAAYKHVPLCETNGRIAIENNVQGSITLIDSAIAASIPKIVIISTDKAVRPTNIMGATKRIVELYAHNVDPQNSEIVAVRFGNVLGSSGSVIPKFKAQIESGGPLTLTHPEITRYFMLIDEACQLVLQAAAIARGGELFILDMGKPVKIADLAQTMIRLYATTPIEIVYTGLRPGEKLYEELLIDESEHKTMFDSILIARSTHYPIDQLRSDIDHLLTTSKLYPALQKIVPEFRPMEEEFFSGYIKEKNS
jgi:UDP-N-acetyl-D-glucosamine 4,6-dehydratase